MDCAVICTDNEFMSRVVRIMKVDLCFWSIISTPTCVRDERDHVLWNAHCVIYRETNRTNILNADYI